MAKPSKKRKEGKGGIKKVKKVTSDASPASIHPSIVEPESDSTSDVDSDPYKLKNAYYLKHDSKYKYKQKTLIFASKGVSKLGRLLLKDLRNLMPHHKAEVKWDRKQSYTEINDLCEIAGAKSVIYLENKKGEMILWLAKSPSGPTVKCRIFNVHTLLDSHFAGNCLLYSRPILTFDKSFEDIPHLKLIRVLFTQIFGTPNNHPKSKPFYDHSLSFFYLDKRIYVRHYQISPVNEHGENKADKQELTEIGPQFVLDIALILEGSFNGATLWKNKDYVSYSMMRKFYLESKAEKQKSRKKKQRLEEEEDELSNRKVFAAPE